MPGSARNVSRSLKTKELQCIPCLGAPPSALFVRHESRTSRDPGGNVVCSQRLARGPCSAGNTRGLIEARGRAPAGTARRSSVPRGIPAASLKLQRGHPGHRQVSGVPRGIPAASLKQVADHLAPHVRPGVPRGIPAASLKHRQRVVQSDRAGRVPRGIPAASLKPRPI